MNNYEFCAQWILNHRALNSVRVLDYGCGAGQIVEELRKMGVDAFGCDVFYEGGERSRSADPDLLGKFIRRMEGNAIPFDDKSFDFVVNNQVMEHVQDLDSVLADVQRVLKPGGIVLSLFPDRGVWREGHCGIPFLHWFDKGSRPRIYYAAALRAVGFGHHKGNKGVVRWSEDFCDWLDKWTYYRPRTEIYISYSKYFSKTWHLEEDWLRQRLGSRRAVVTLLPPGIQRFIVRKGAGLVFAAQTASIQAGAGGKVD